MSIEIYLLRYKQFTLDKVRQEQKKLYLTEEKRYEEL